MAPSEVPRAGNFDLLDIVRKRTYKLVKAAISNVSKLSDEDNLSTLTVLKDDLLDKWTDYQISFEEHEAALVGAGEMHLLDQVTTEYMAINSSYVKAKSALTDLISDAGESPNSVSTPNTTGLPLGSDVQPTLKLAPLRITPYDGKLASNWIEFKATCDAVLKPTMPEIQRLQELKNALLGEARELVSHILPSDHAYDDAMRILKERYENVRAIVNGHLSKLYAVPCMEKPTAQSFREMLNTLNGLLAGLKCCDVNTESWSPLLIFHLTQRFDPYTLAMWEEKLEGRKTIPPLKTLLSFIETRITVLNSSECSSAAPTYHDGGQRLNRQQQQSQNQRNSFDNKRNGDRIKTYFTLKSTYRCAFCTRNHLPSRCTELNSMSKGDCIALIRRNNLCPNCFYPHAVSDCPFEPACKKCTEPHNTRLHVDGKQMFLTMNDSTDSSETICDPQIEPNDNVKDDDVLSVVSDHHFYHVQDDNDEEVLLASALVPIRSNGRSILVKSLVDQGSTTNLITVQACDLLKLRFARINASMLGVGNSPVGRVVGRVSFEISSIHDTQYSLKIRAIVVRSIGDIKGLSKNVKWNHLNGLTLADPQYCESSKIDILLGNAAHADFILPGVIKGERGEPIAQQSKLGWIISGSTKVSSECLKICRLTHFGDITNSHEELMASLKCFWEIEETKYEHMLTHEEQMAEEVFKRSVRRANNGKFIVDLPFKANPYDMLGDSYAIAKRRYHQLLRKLDKNPELKEQYDAVLEEYLALNHMELVNDQPKFQYYLPHHGVFKEQSTSTKLRIVFDASAKTSTNVSLNDCLCVGPVVQTELFDLLASWRKFEFAVSADIEKMYRMLYVSPEHTDLQSILWHRPGTPGIATYRLSTVTFGTSSAPFQATRGLFEIGERIKTENSELAEIIQNHFYVDDFLKSFATISAAQQASSDLSDTLSEYGFKLRKWKSNDPRTISKFSNIDKEMCIDFESTFKTLGICWHADTDSFVFKSIPQNETTVWTKRKVLSAISKLYDPLGWLAPYIIKAKILMQNIWRDPNGMEWDTLLPEHLHTEWTPIINDLSKSISIKVPRWIKMSNGSETVEIHSFCDASNLAYASCVYLRVIHQDGSISCNLIAAKTKVAPLRVVTIPRLELCGALLLAQLTTKCIQALKLDEFKMTAWCDSKIVLAWLATHPSKWTTFVANRVSQIQQIVNANSWKHVPSKQNPADVASRGSSIEDLKSSNMWWHGPAFLSTSAHSEPKQEFKLPINNAPEKRKKIEVFHIAKSDDNYVVQKFETYHRLLHFTSMAFRWINRVRDKHTSLNGPITASEIQTAEDHWIKLTQREKQT